MKNRLISLFIFTTVLLLIASGCSSSSSNTSGEDNKEKAGAGNETIELSIAHSLPSTHPIETEVIKSWAESIGEASDGRIKIKSYPVDTLLASDQIYDGVINGVADMGLSFFAYTPGRFPIMSSIELPGIPIKNAKVGTRIGMDILEEFNPQEIQDTKVMLVGTTGSAFLITQNPVEKLADLSGLELRTTGASAGGVEALGGVAVSMPMSEAYESLSKKVVKGILGATEIIHTFNLGEVTQYITETPFMYNGLYFIAMNKEKWESIPADLQEIIEEENKKLYEEILPSYWDQSNENGLQSGIDAGMEVITLPEEEVAKWFEVLEDYQQKHVDELEGNGLPGGEVLEKIKTLAEEYNKEFE